MLRISLVTPSFQQAAYLEECLRSVHDQGYPALEHLVVDGGSTDGSREIIIAHADQLAWWCSEMDQGQSDALNKGLARATGDLFGWLNSDDMLLPGTLHRVASAFEQDPELVVFGGRSLLRSATGDTLPERVVDTRDERRFMRNPGFDQPSTFFRMDAVREVGGLETRLHYVMDYELVLRLAFHFGTERMRFVDEPLAVARLHDDCKTVRYQRRFLDERSTVLHGVCLSAGREDLAGMLALGHRISPGIRPMPVPEAKQGLAKEMVTHFLLKWHHTIHVREQFTMMRAFRRRIDISDVPLDDTERARLGKLDRQLKVPGWLAFRAGRKLRHLRGSR